MSSSDRLAAAVRMMTPPGSPDCSRNFWTIVREPAALVAGVDLARDADVVDRRHVDQEPARQAEVRGDPRALGAERLLDDLDDDLLPFLEQVFDAGGGAWRGRAAAAVGRAHCPLTGDRRGLACRLGDLGRFATPAWPWTARGLRATGLGRRSCVTLVERLAGLVRGPASPGPARTACRPLDAGRDGFVVLVVVFLEGLFGRTDDVVT